MALHVSTSSGEQLYFRHHLVLRYMGIKNDPQQMTQSEALMEKFK